MGGLGGEAQQRGLPVSPGKPWQVKVKKDYIPGLAETVDLGVVGGRRDAKVVQTLGVGNLSWTTFFLACLDNKNEIRRSGARPAFRTVGAVMRPCVSIKDFRRLNELSRLHQLPFARRRTEAGSARSSLSCRTAYRAFYDADRGGSHWSRIRPAKQSKICPGAHPRPGLGCCRLELARPSSEPG